MTKCNMKYVLNKTPVGYKGKKTVDINWTESVSNLLGTIIDFL